MKNQKTTASFNVTFFKVSLSIIIAILCLFVNNLSAQQKMPNRYHVGAGVSANVSGNAHGAIINTYVSAYDGKNLFSGGPCIQSRSGKISGLRIGYSRVLTGRDNFSRAVTDFETNEIMQLYFISYAQYLHNTSLGIGALAIEKQFAMNNSYSDKPNVDFNNVRFSTAEIAAGFGMNFKLSNKIVLGAYLCAGTYYHTKNVGLMHKKQINPMLVLGTSISFNYFR